jgi:hypothetical protein
LNDNHCRIGRSDDRNQSFDFTAPGPLALTQQIAGAIAAPITVCEGLGV